MPFRNASNVGPAVDATYPTRCFGPSASAGRNTSIARKRAARKCFSLVFMAGPFTCRLESSGRKRRRGEPVELGHARIGLEGSGNGTEHSNGILAIALAELHDHGPGR